MLRVGVTKGCEVIADRSATDDASLVIPGRAYLSVGIGADGGGRASGRSASGRRSMKVGPRVGARDAGGVAQRLNVGYSLTF
ncbi:hypothetical protein NPX13_g10766 [Xylaria arbuscula]|uniref:Uncharacterized protein n=1 Tax=Xylaria arbuscula TaxID=114810 RepID=A0A9W8N453_9PEZI|nr:hypothetical protein NPX13_g10766 [Xylaria arbuscula]